MERPDDVVGDGVVIDPNRFVNNNVRAFAGKPILGAVSSLDKKCLRREVFAIPETTGK